jgi:aryl-alcohol dehydrogenase-like predicted oxidoreductase
MQTTTLGTTGLKISRLVLGTMTFGLQTDEPTSHAILDVAASAGVNFLDTADVYPVGGGLPTVGRTEEIERRTRSFLRRRKQPVPRRESCWSSTARAQAKLGAARVSRWAT